MGELSLEARLGRATLEALFQRLRGCEIELVDGSRRRRFGESGAPLRFRIDVRDPAFYRRAAFGGEISAIESYGDGQWDCDDLFALCQVVFRNQGAWNVGAPVARLAQLGRRVLHKLRHNSRRNSRRNVSAHYDVGNDFYELFLDETLTYSAGIFESAESTLEEASTAKYARLCRELEIGPGDHVLEIGSGWGGFALYAASRHGCRVTTTTISRQQYELAGERIEKAGLRDRITLLFEDYRDLKGEYDKLVSIEMVEAVGHEYHDTYFGVCSERLAPHGAMALQAICVPDQRWHGYLRSTDFVRHWVFPGGCLLSLGAITESARRSGDLRVSDVLDIGPHYAETLRRWRRRLRASWDAARARGYEERFLRLWDFYFASCQAAFHEHHIADLQVVLEKPESRRGAPCGIRH